MTQKHHIAIVEDVSDNRFILRALLEPYFKVSEFENGFRFASALATFRFDAVLLDISMPEMDGFDVLRLIQSMPAWQDVPVIAVTAHAMQGDRERALDAGFCDYVVKPFDFEDLVSRLFRQIQKPSRLARA